MPTPRWTLRAVAAAALLVATSTAQQEPNKHLRTLLGRFVDQAGKDIADAEVHLVFSPVGAQDGNAGEHQVITTDKRGRFRFKARPCTRHLLWAIGPEDDDKMRQVSAMRWATPGAPVQLRATEKHPQVTVTVKGLEKWADYGPFQLALAPGEIRIPGLTVPVADDFTSVMPPLPAGRTTLDVMDKNGQPLACLTLRTFKAATSRTVRPMRSVPMVVVDDKGNPIENALIRQRVSVGSSDRIDNLPQPPGRIVWRELGKTNAAGELTGKIANSKDPFETSGWQHLMFTATKDGYSISHSGFRRHPFFDGKEVKQEGKKELRFTLRKDQPTVVRFMRNNNDALVGQPVTVRRGVKIEQLKNNGWTHEGLVFHLTTDETGRIKIPLVSNPIDKLQFVIGGDLAQTTFVADDKRRMSPDRAFALHELKASKDKELLINVGAFAKVQMRLLDESGNPAPDAQVMLISRDRKGEYDCSGWSTMATPDSAGRLALQLQPGEWAIFARTRLGMSYAKIDVEPGEQKPLDVRMSPMPTMLGRAVDGAGKPIANAKLSCHSSTWHSGGDRDQVLENIASSLNWTWINNTTTDKDGNFACTFLDLPGMTYEGRLRANGNQSKSFSILAGEDPVTIEIK